MGFLSFGSKKDKIKKLLEEERFDEVLAMITKDKKARNDFLSLLDDENPGVRGDALLTLSMLIENDRAVFSDIVDERLFKKLYLMMNTRNPYVRENAMILSSRMLKAFPDLVRVHRRWLVEAIKRELKEGDNFGRGFAIVAAGELRLKELAGVIENFTGVEDKVVLPFEGKKWVKIGDLAREALERLSE
ncbi:MAG: hypothetical protein GXO14_04250 [Thermococci archaeon]|nr:hypothetical protein [Thermococci archaeon]